MSFVEGSKWFARCQMYVSEAVSFEQAQPRPSTTFRRKVMDKIRRRREPRLRAIEIQYKARDHEPLGVDINAV